jgi:hypothetical protein
LGDSYKKVTDYVEKLEEKGSDMATKKLLEELGDDFRKS